MKNQSYTGNPDDFDADDEFLDEILNRNQRDKERDVAERQMYAHPPQGRDGRQGETVDNTEEVENARRRPPSHDAVARAKEAARQRDWDYLQRKENETLSALDPNYTEKISPVGGHMAELDRIKESLGRSADVLRKEPDDMSEGEYQAGIKRVLAEGDGDRKKQWDEAEKKNMRGITKAIESTTRDTSRDFDADEVGSRREQMRKADEENMRGIRGALKATTAGINQDFDADEEERKRKPLSLKELRNLTK